MSTSKAVILVGGDTRGTRFRPISLSVPKVLFPAGGKPLLEHAVEACIKQQVAEILLIGYYENSVFDDFLADFSRHYPNVTIRYLREYKAMGTAGGLYHFRDQILRGKPQWLFLINADVCSSWPLQELQSLQQEKGAEAVILGTRVPRAISKNFGAIITGGEQEPQKVLHYVEKPDEPVSTLVNGGIYLLSTSVFEVIASAKANHERLEAMNDEFDDDLLQLEQDVLPTLADHGSLYVYTTTSFWRQVKEASSALVANRLYLDEAQAKGELDASQLGNPNIKSPVIIDPTASISPTAVIGPNVTVGPFVKLGDGARVRDAIVLERSEVRDNGVVLSAILCPRTRVGRWARVEGSPVGPQDYASTVIKDGIKVPRVAILAHDVTVSDEVHVQNAIVLPHKDIKDDVKNEIVM